MVVDLEHETKIRRLKALIKKGQYKPTPLEELLRRLAGRD